MKKEEQNKNLNTLIANEIRKYIEIINYEKKNIKAVDCHICQHYVPYDEIDVY